ncbi:MAG TPA: protein kinase, partial [Labilithrix sp.]
PEQLRNSQDIDGRADLWSLGIVAYELLSGRVPFDGEGVGEIFAAVLEKEVEPLSAVNPVVTPALAKVIERCFAREPDQRWRDAGEMARALVPYASPACVPLVDRAEQVLARAKMLQLPDTPPEARVVVDAIVAAAKRARTGVMSVPPPKSEKKRLELASETSTELTHPEGLTMRVRMLAKSMPRSRLVGLVAVAVVLVSISAFAAVRAARTSANAAAASSAAVANGPQAAGSGSAGEDDDENAPMVMDLPDNGGHASGNVPARSRAVKSGRPQRPKFLKSRE